MKLLEENGTCSSFTTQNNNSVHKNRQRQRERDYTAAFNVTATTNVSSHLNTNVDKTFSLNAGMWGQGSKINHGANRNACRGVTGERIILPNHATIDCIGER